MKISQDQAEQIEKIFDNYLESDCYTTEAEDVITDILCILEINYRYIAEKLVINFDEDDAE